MARLLFFVLALIAAVHAKHERYEGHRLFRITGPSAEIRVLDDELDLWGVDRTSGADRLGAVLRLAPEEEDQWLQTFTNRGISYNVMNDNVADMFRKEDEMLERSRVAAKARDSEEEMSWNIYYRHEEINDYLDQLATDYPDLLTVINAGLSYEGRQIKYVRISSTRFENLMKPVIIIDAAVHAREWVTPPTAMNIIQQLLNNRTELTDSVDWVIIPIANPDGYEYTFTDDRLWRKTRSTSHEGSDGGHNCAGVDGNRNFDHAWGTPQAVSNPCQITYQGPSPFSEPETRVIRDVVLQNIDRAALYISLHSFGNMFLYSWGNNGTLPPNGLFLHLAGVTMATAIDDLALDKADRYVVGNAANVLYFSTGTSRDWTRSVGIPLTYTLELPGYEYGFLVPPDYIKQIVTETWAGIAAGARFVLDQW